MQLYLINKNPIISKLVTLSAQKLGVEMAESETIDLSLSADIVLLDDECYEAENFNTYKEANKDAKMILFHSKAVDRIEGFDTYIQKPFLPTDLVATLREVSGLEIVEESLGRNSDIVELDNANALDFDESLDFSNLDDLQLDGEDSEVKDTGDEPLDFGADDLPKEEGIEAQENLDEQLDFGGDDGVPQEKPQVLDEGDVDTIKNLLDDSSDDVSSDDHLLDIDLDSELGQLQDDVPSADEALQEESKETDIADSNDNALLDFDLEKELGQLQEDAPSIQDEALEEESTEENTEESNGNALDNDALLDFDLEKELGQLQDDVPSADEALHEESLETNVGEDVSAEIDFSACALPDSPDLQEDSIAQDMEDSTKAENAQEDENVEFDLSDLALSLEQSLQEEQGAQAQEVATMEAENVEDTLESLGELSQDLGMDTADFTDMDSNVIEDLEIPQEYMQEELGENILEDIPEESMESMQELASMEEPQAESKNADISETLGGDEFAELSLEGISEALGEPIQKAPIPTPLVTQESPKDMQLSNIQANSLESLIGALQSLQTQSLKELLSGATINISIQFPKKDEK